MKLRFALTARENLDLLGDSWLLQEDIMLLRSCVFQLLTVNFTL